MGVRPPRNAPGSADAAAAIPLRIGGICIEQRRAPQSAVAGPRPRPPPCCAPLRSRGKLAMRRFAASQCGWARRAGRRGEGNGAARALTDIHRPVQCYVFTPVYRHPRAVGRGGEGGKGGQARPQLEHRGVGNKNQMQRLPEARADRRAGNPRRSARAAARLVTHLVGRTLTLAASSATSTPAVQPAIILAGLLCLCGPLCGLFGPLCGPCDGRAPRVGSSNAASRLMSSPAAIWPAVVVYT